MAWEPKTLWESAAPITWLNWAVGLGTIEIPAGHPRPVVSRIFNIVINIMYFSLAIWCTPRMPSNWVVHEMISFMFVWWTNVIVAMYSIFLGWFRSKDMKKIIMRCAEIDDTLEVFGVEKRYGKVFCFLLMIVIVGFFYLCVLTIADFLWFSQFGAIQSMYINILLHVPITVNSVVDLTFLGLVGCIGSKIHAVNNLMSEVFENEYMRKFDVAETVRSHRLQKIMVIMGYNTRKNFLKHFVETIKQVHLEIVRISHAINRTYSLQILLEMAVQLTLLTGTLYNMYFLLTLTTLPSAMRDQKAAALILWLIFCLAKVLTVNGICEAVSSEAIRTAQIISKIDGVYEDEEITEEIQQFSLQLILHPLYFTASGLIRLNNQFTRMFFSTIATYLVLLIQMTTTPSSIKPSTKVRS